MLSSFAGADDLPHWINEISDDMLVRDIERRLNQPGYGRRGAVPESSPVHDELLQELETIRPRCPQWSIGQLVFNLASLAHRNEYHVEDEELLQAVHRVGWFEEYETKWKAQSTLAPRQERVSFRCPCCGHRTLKGRGYFEICATCYWLDDGQDEADADSRRGGPNGSISLTEARCNFRTVGAFESKYKEYVRPPRADEI